MDFHIAPTIILRAKESGKELSVPILNAYGVLIGRGDLCDLRLTSDDISVLHTRLRPSDEDGWFVHDLGSRNGTFVNGALAAKHGTPLNVGDTLGVARFEYKVEHLPPAADIAKFLETKAKVERS